MIHRRVYELFADDAAVSSVVGVVLMIAVTIVLAAVIGGFVFGVGDHLNQPTPEAGVDFQYNSTTEQLEVTHAGGDLITPGDTSRMSVSGEFTGGHTWNEDKFADDDLNSDEAELEETIEATDLIWYSDEEGVQSGESVTITWISDDGRNSATLGSFTAP